MKSERGVVKRIGGGNAELNASWFNDVSNKQQA
jgi:hypothetical protein